MAPWLVVWLVIGLVSTVAIVVCLIGLVRHALILGRSAQAFQRELQPIVDELAREGAKASETGASISRRRPGGAARG
jgi:hypothetical protein